MINRILLAIGGILFTISASAQWTNHDTPTSGIRFIEVINSSLAIAGGDNGSYKTTDGGNTWTLIQYNFVGATLQNGYLYSTSATGVCFTDASTGFLYGSSAFGYMNIFRTTDGGASWYLVYYNGGGQISSMHFPTSSIGYATTTLGKVVKTIDGGATWTELTAANTSKLQGIHFADATHGVAVGVNVILVTSDGGATWTKTTTTMDLRSVTHSDNNTLYSAGQSNMVRSTNGGVTWTDAVQNLPAPAETSWVSATVGFAKVLSGGLWKTNDGGNFWAPQHFFDNSGVGGFEMLPDGNGYAYYANNTTAIGGRIATTATSGDPVPTHEAAAAELIDYSNELCRGTYPISVKIINKNSVALTSAVIKWTVNGVSQPDYNWTGNVAVGATSSAFVIGSYNFNKTARDYVVVASTFNPNGAADPYTIDDSTTKTYRFDKFTGSYVVGGAGADFMTLTEGVGLLKQHGMCSAITFNINSGVYDDLISFDNFSGTSSTNTLTFQSVTGKAADVVFTSPAFANYIAMSIKDTKYITIRNISFNNVALAIVVTGNSDGTIIENNILSSSSTESDVLVIGQATGSIKIRNNKIRGGDAGLRYSVSPTPGPDLVIDGNIFEDQKRKGIRIESAASATISNNIIKLNASGTWAPNGDAGMYGILFANLEGTVTVYNNFIELISSSSQAYLTGVNAYRGAGTINLYNNTIYTRGLTSTPVINLIETKNSKIKNNDITNYGVGDVVAYTNNTGLIVDYNNIYARNGTIGGYVSPTMRYASVGRDLKNWQEVSGLDMHSVSADPQHIDGNFHVVPKSSNMKLDGAGTPIAGITTDLDGDIRNATTPDIGADEFSGPSTDLGFSDVPATAFACGQGFNVTVTNFGTTTINSFDLTWTMNAVPHVQHYAQPLLSKASLVVMVGPVSGAGIVSIALTASGDQIATNNTGSTEIKAGGMSGSYTIGGPSPSFAKISDAITAVQTNGLCGNVTFNIRPGSYNEALRFGNVPGASDDRRVIFQSSTRDSTTVIIGGSNASIEFLNASFITLRNVSIGDGNPAAYVKVDILNSSHITLERNYITTVHALNVGVRFAAQAPSEYNIIKENFFALPATAAVAVVDFEGLTYLPPIGGGATYQRYARGNVFDGNVVVGDPGINAGYSLLKVVAQDGFTLSNNTASSNMPWGISVEDCINAYSIVGNRIQSMLINTSGGDNTIDAVIANNFINGTLMVHYSDNLKILNNTIIAENNNPDFAIVAIMVNDVSPSSTGLPPRTRDRIMVKNNIIVARGKADIVVYNPDDLIDSDYNVFYGTNDKFAMNWSGSYGETGYITRYATLAAWTTGTGKDPHSQFIDPTFVSAADFHIANDTRLKRKGTNVGVATDIDGDGRLVATPDIGADEFSLLATDAGVVSFTTELLCGPTTDIKVKIRNFSGTALTQVKVRWSVNGAEQPMKSWTGSLASRQTSAEVSLGSFNFQSQTNYTFKFWTDLPNGIADENLLNDAIEVGPYLNVQSSDFTIVSNSGKSIFCTGNAPLLSVNGPLDLPYTYTWKKDATVVGSNATLNLTTGGNFSVELAAKGCKFTPTPVVITESTPPAAQTITSASALEFCAGGSVKLSVPAGFQSYNWSNGSTTREITVSTAGNYSVKVSNVNGCESASSAVMTVVVNALPVKPAIMAGGPLTFCDGGSVVLSAPSGYTTYTWSNGSSNRQLTADASGEFSVTVTDANNCVSPLSDKVIVVESAAIPVPVIALDGPPNFCEGTGVNLSGPNGFAKYEWSNGKTDQTISVMTATTTTLIVSDANNCKSQPSAGVVTVVKEKPTASVTIVGNELHANSGGDNYAWYVDDSEIPNASSPVYVPTFSGDYSVKVSKGGCSTQSFEVNFTITGLETAVGFEMYPNPAASSIIIQGEAVGDVAFDLIDVTGRKQTPNITSRSSDRVILNLESLSSGVYFIEGTWKGKVIRSRVVVVR